MNPDDYYIEDLNQANNTIKTLHFSGIFIGTVIFLTSFIVLFFNERKHMSLHFVRVKLADYLIETNEADKENDNRLIFAKGNLEFREPA